MVVSPVDSDWAPKRTGQLHVWVWNSDPDLSISSVDRPGEVTAVGTITQGKQGGVRKGWVDRLGSQESQHQWSSSDKWERAREVGGEPEFDGNVELKAKDVQKVKGAAAGASEERGVLTESGKCSRLEVHFPLQFSFYSAFDPHMCLCRPMIR